MIMKKIINTIIATVVAISISACCLFKDGEEVSWDKVNTVCAVVQTAAQTSVYAVCVKNPDLSPIFKAVGAGLVNMSGKNYSPEQIKTYIANALKKEEWGTLANQVNAIMDTLMITYTNFYETNKNKFTDEANICIKVVNAIGKGLITGSVVSGQPASANPEIASKGAIESMQKLDLNVAK
jgi:hypothetical protein